ncbi:MAG: aspartate/glutamate racemase family protein [Deltaproteobacteria bacterium]|nr:aspartate/glutamate racemase family protein [Deltaproteobacteria bacterium]MBT7156129.1 aspartate/glutamate racemase family protein [Deltaproteobacteria bacterium]
MNEKNTNPMIGILGWEEGTEITLSQLEEMPGNIANPNTFDFPVLYRRVKGANFQTVVKSPNQKVLREMIKSARQMEAEGIRAILTSCGFNAIFHQELSNSVNVPFISSSLMQVPLVSLMLQKDQVIGIITADQESLSEDHLRAVGITDDHYPIVIGIEHTEEFSKICRDAHAVLDQEKFINEVVEVARELTRLHPNTGAIVLECTDLPPCADEIRASLKIPVFDIVTLTNMVYKAVTSA